MNFDCLIWVGTLWEDNDRSCK